jgi:hypothetical protein
MKLVNDQLSGTERLVNLIAHLVDHSWTIPELCAEIGLANSTVRLMIKHLRAYDLVHVSGWTEDKFGRQLSPEFKFNPGGVDVKRRAPQNEVQKAQKRTARMQALRLNRRMAGA